MGGILISHQELGSATVTFDHPCLLLMLIEGLHTPFGCTISSRMVWSDSMVTDAITTYKL